MSQYQVRTLSLITAISDKSRDIRGLTHEALCNATMHAAQHGDVTLCNGILHALGKGHDRKLVIDWLKEFGCAKWNKVTLQFELAKERRKALQLSAVTLDELLANPAWHEYGKETKDLVREFDVIAKLKSVVKGYDNAKGDDKPTKNDWAVGAVAALLAKLEAEVAAGAA